MLLKALQANQARIMAFLFSILIAVTFLGALMYVVEVRKLALRVFLAVSTGRL